MIPPPLARDLLVAHCEVVLNEGRLLHEELLVHLRETAYTLTTGAVVPPRWCVRRAAHKVDADGVDLASP
jgi:hypothetical protein